MKIRLTKRKASAKVRIEGESEAESSDLDAVLAGMPARPVDTEESWTWTRTVVEGLIARGYKGGLVKDTPNIKEFVVTRDDGTSA